MKPSRTIAPRAPKKSYDATVATRIPKEMRADLEAIQARMHPTMSELLKAALRDYVEKHKPHTGA